jgi:transposase
VVRELEEAVMTIVVGLDQHREQITFDALDTETGELSRGRIVPATRESVREWLQRWQGCQLEAACEATTGWLFLVEELERVGARVHLAEPAETAARRGPKRRAKTDRLDARHLRELLQTGRLPESWIPPEPIQQLRTAVRLRKTLVDERTAWLLRIHATLFQHGLPRTSRLLAGQQRAQLESLPLPATARERVTVALALADAIDRQLVTVEETVRSRARQLPGCRALQANYGIGELTAAAIVAELGDPARFGSSRRALRHSGLDITVHATAGRRGPGRLSRQGPPVLRWALYEAAKQASRAGSPDHAYYRRVRARLGAKRATLAVARKLLRRAYHQLQQLGDTALTPTA